MAAPRGRSTLPIAITIVGAVLLFIVLPLITWFSSVWIDFLWFADLGQKSVFLTRIWSELAIGAVFAAMTFVVLYVNMRVARKMAPRATPVAVPNNVPEQFAVVLQAIRTNMGPILDRAILWGSLILAFLNGLGMAAQWQTFRLALNAVPFGYVDPQFGKDVSFFVFLLPAFTALADWAMGLLILTTILTAAVHVADGAIQPWARFKGFAPHVKAHLSVLAAFIVAVWGFQYWIDIYKLDFSVTGQIIGAGYTDVHAQLPAYWILIGVSAVTAIALLLNIRYKGWRLPLTALAVWVAAGILLGVAWPALTQAFIVSPNEQVLEAPYISRNIAMTRTAFGLNDVKGQSFPADESLTATGVISDPQTIQNVRLWDPKVVGQSYAQLQSIRPYYEFPDVDVDRYVINGVEQQVLVSAREMNSSSLPAASQTWVNQHLAYTHGFGLVMSPVNSADSRGLPQFIIGDIPPTTTSDLKITEPRIYFGEATTDYAIVDTKSQEFDYPQGETNAYNTYKGKGGVPVGNLAQRLAWAIDLGSTDLFLSPAVGSNSRVLMRRDLMTRLKTLAPFLTFENDAYPVLVNGRILWVIDGYTSTDSFPYSEGLPNDPSTTYLRNSVKVTVDAFDGTTTFYAFDKTDPILQAWRKVFPSLVVDGDKIPQDVRDHFRYPQGIFEAQAEIYRTYHMTDPRVFYNKEDQWELPGERIGKTVEPFYVLMKLPGQTAEHFYLMQPYTPRNRDNMIGWVAANSDPGSYGERTVYLFPKDRVVLGPQQVSARIEQDSVISPQLSLWRQGGSQVLLGNMLVLPIKNSIVYIQPLYLQADTTAIPELTRVIVAYSDKVEMEATLQDALMKVFGQQAPSTASDGSTTATGTPLPAATTGDAALAQQLYLDATKAQRAGDWATYGAKITELGKVLERLASARGSKAATATK
ncbi:MAG: UPF0182 family protein [Coriobacteriia bacterium]|nr:UPF0182 family protein [Coriobacteriia bacterium]